MTSIRKKADTAQEIVRHLRLTMKQQQLMLRSLDRTNNREDNRSLQHLGRITNVSQQLPRIAIGLQVPNGTVTNVPSSKGTINKEQITVQLQVNSNHKTTNRMETGAITAIGDQAQMLTITPCSQGTDELFITSRIYRYSSRVTQICKPSSALNASSRETGIPHMALHGPH